jgi:hypothetical protein
MQLASHSPFIFSIRDCFAGVIGTLIGFFFARRVYAESSVIFLRRDIPSAKKGAKTDAHFFAKEWNCRNSPPAPKVLGI